MSQLVRASRSSRALPHNMPLRRAYSQSPQHQAIENAPIAVIAGAGAKTARSVITMLLRRGIPVIALTGQEMPRGVEGLHIKRVPRSEYGNASSMRAHIEEALHEARAPIGSHIIGINLIGGAVVPTGMTLEQLNHDIPLNFFTGLLDAVKDKTDRVSLAHLSSITITLLGGETACPYILSKEKVEESLFRLNQDGTVISLRPGMICSGLQFDTTHDYAPEQLARLPLIPVLGSGDQIMQPVGEECLYTALINGLVQEEVIREVINAVGAEALTQKELFAFFAEAAKTNFVHVPPKFAHVIAKHFPKGRIAPYAIEIFKMLDAKPEKNQPICGERFGQLLGRKPLGLKEIYQEGTLVTRSAPIGEHALEMIRSPREALKVAAAAVMSVKDFYFTSHDKK